MPIFIGQGKTLKLRLSIARAADTVVTFKRGDAVLTTMTVLAARFETQQDGARAFAPIEWAAPMLAADQNDLDVVMSHDKAGAAPPTAIKVFRDTLVVKIVQTAEPAPAPVPNVALELAIEADHDWRMFTNRPKPPAIRMLTNAAGEARFDKLPYGTFEVTVLRTGMTPVGPIAKTPGTWTLTVHPQVVAKIISPAPRKASEEPHTRWVNLDAEKAPEDPARESFGSLVRVAVRSEIAGVMAPRQAVWLGVMPSPANSPRTHFPRPKLQGVPTEIGKLKVVKLITDDTGHAVFELQLGVSGGDQVVVFAAGRPVTEMQFDDRTAFVNWRRLELWTIKLRFDDDGLHPTPAEVLAATPEFPEGTKSLVTAELKRAYIEAVWKPVELNVGRLPAEERALLRVATGDTARAIGLDPAKQHLIWTPTSTAFSGPDKVTRWYRQARETQFYPPRISLLGVSMACTSKQKPITIEVAGTKTTPLAAAIASIQIPLGGSFVMTRDFAGNPILSPPSHWTEQGKPEQHPITADMLHIPEGSKGLKCELRIPADQRAAVTKPIKVVLNLRSSSTTAGSAALGRVTVCLEDATGPDAAKVNAMHAYAICHEIGHAAHLSVSEPSNRYAQRGPEAKNELFFEMDGSHCSFGVKPNPGGPSPWLVRTNDFVNFFGLCCMYSPSHVATPYEKAYKYCPTCLDHLKSSSLGQYRSPALRPEFEPHSDIDGFRNGQHLQREQLEAEDAAIRAATAALVPL